MTSIAGEQPEILFERRGAAGIVTLNRPGALNAVTHGMVRALAATLAAWADDPAVGVVVITAAGGRAFSAGGDIRALHDLGRAGRQAEALAFWRDEYALNAFIKRYPKPYVALIDGIVMGGGVGVSIHGSHRVAGEKFVFAMPEVGIGFFPDVGATFLLPRLPGEIGTYLALTGGRIGSADAIATGIATHQVPSARFAAVLDALCGAQPPDAVLAAFAAAAFAAPAFAAPAFAAPQGNSPVTARRVAIGRMFAGARVDAMLDRLDREARAGGPDAAWAQATATTLRGKSPTSLKIALAQMRRGPHWSFSECMKAEFRIVSRIVYGHDFYEGIRAVIIDKDNRPSWRPALLADVDDAEVARHFDPIDEELVLP